jgi:hypothetical protein
LLKREACQVGKKPLARGLAEKGSRSSAIAALCVGARLHRRAAFEGDDISAVDLSIRTINQRMNDGFSLMNNISSITCFNLLQERTRCRNRCLIFRQSPIND